MDDPAIQTVVSDQMQQWSDMMDRHRKEEWNLLKEHLKSQEDILRKLMEAEQAAQIKKLEARYDLLVMNNGLYKIRSNNALYDLYLLLFWEDSK